MSVKIQIISCLTFISPFEDTDPADSESAMAFLVKKFGGTSLATLENIHKVATIIEESYAQGDKIIAVVSAMEGVTNQLVSWAHDVAKGLPFNEESDVVLASGEQVSAGLLARALQSRGLSACSWLAWQLPIATRDHSHGADILHIETQGIKNQVEQGIIPVVAGFQGLNPHGRLSTLGRGGSDTTAVALAASVNADACYIYTDVPGVHRVDPKLCSGSKAYDVLNYEDMGFLARHGAKILHDKAIDIAKRSHMPIHVLSTFDPKGHQTRVVAEAPYIRGIAQKDVLSWEIGCITPQEVQDLYTHFQKDKPFFFFDWHIAAEGLRFLTTHDVRQDVERRLPKGVEPKPRVLLTLLGYNAQQVPDYGSLEVERLVFFPRAIGLLVKPQVCASILHALNERLDYDLPSS